MKTRFLFFCMIAANLLSAQIEFAPIGAVWTYDYARHQERGLERIECIGDTVINGESARVLTISRTYINLTQPEDTLVRIFEHKYVRQSGDTVFLYHNDAFRLIYNFGAVPVSFDYVIWNDTTHYDFVIYTISLTDTLINSINVQIYVTINTCNLIDIGYSKSIILMEGIGALDGHLLYYSDYDCNFDLIGNLKTTRFHLRCYSVNGEVMYTSSPGVDCDVLTRTADPSQHDGALSIFPNPARNYTYVNLGGFGNSGGHRGIKLILYEASGKKIAVWFSDDLPLSLNVSSYPTGIYYLQVVDGERIFRKKLIIAR
ncbi:MAG: T9SS type A sorting domain-containing protein [Saprospiraceae bacterium]|nr:T9SS type A sorting domain-containing protein [Saprospiraceae bacterium]